VVTEGILIGMKRGLTKLQASNAIVKQTMWPLLGATIIAITAFAPIGLSNDSTGEMLGSLYYVLLISLLLSWFTAISLTPFFADMLLKQDKPTTEALSEEDAYQGLFFTVYKRFLDFCLRQRIITVAAAVALLVASLMAFQQVKVVFFPSMTTPMFLVDYWRPQGTDIRETFKDIQALEEWVLQQEHVKQVSSNTGKGGIRFMLTYAPEKIYPGYGQLMVEVDNFKQIDGLINKIDAHIQQHYPASRIKFKKFELGPAKDGKIEVRVSGPDPDVLRQISGKIKAIYEKDTDVAMVRDDWQERTKVIRPIFAEAQARRAGISKADLDSNLLMSFGGEPIGLYRDGTKLLPIIARPPANERLNVDSLPNLQIWSPAFSTYIPIEQVIREFKTTWEDPIIARRDRKRTLTVLVDPVVTGKVTVNEIFERHRPEVEAIALPGGYQMEWGGEYESSGDAQSALFGSLILGLVLMFLITVQLFKTVRQPLAIWSMVPLAMVGVGFGLYVTATPFTFIALLGLISLIGMLLKNAIVLVDQINYESGEGKELYPAIFDSAVSRVRPVSMAAITTILGMLPLLMDAFFRSMAVTIMFGLGFATILTLIVLPVMYALLYKAPYRPLTGSTPETKS
jgi:multidrug efflux pump subunit AcrB